jgi:hypothetical protein
MGHSGFISSKILDPSLEIVRVPRNLAPPRANPAIPPASTVERALGNVYADPTPDLDPGRISEQT